MKRLLTLLPLLLLLCSCAPREETQTGYYFDTVITLTLPADTNAGVFDKAWALCERYDRLFDRFSGDSDLARLSSGTPTVVDPETAALIQTALDLNEQTGGAFDIRLGGVSDLWQFTSGTLPDPDAVSAAVTAAQTSTVTIDGDTVTLSGGAKLDLGGIAKGYVTDRLVALLKEEGCTRAILNLGGNVYCLGSKDGAPFSVGIDTLMETDAPPLALSDRAAVTAGVNQRFMTVDGVDYHHILNPQTGYPAQSGLVSATVIADSAALADALSTACVVLGREKAGELIAQFPGVSAVLVAEDGAVFPVQNPQFVETAQK